MDQRPDVSEKVRSEYSGNEGVSRLMPCRRIHHTDPKGTAGEKQDALRATIKELEDSISYIDWKQNFYDEVLSGKRPYVSNLIQTDE